MTATDFTAGMRRLGMTQATFAAFAGVSLRTVNGWAATGPTPIAERLVVALLALDRAGIDWRTLKLEPSEAAAE